MKAGYGDGATHKKGPSVSASSRNPKEFSGKGGSYAIKKTATKPAEPIEVNKGKAPRTTLRESTYNQGRKPVNGKVDPNGTTNHPPIKNLFKNIRAGQK